MSKVRWGIIGAGNIAHKLADAVHKNPDSDLISVASKTANKAQAFAEKYEIDFYSNYGALVCRDDIDVVYVATTHNFHYENVLLALNNGKHVLVEKPFTVNAKEAQELADIAHDNNLFLMEAIWVRFLPSIMLLKETIKKDVIGKIKYFNVSFGGYASSQYIQRLTDLNLAGGVTLDMGIYPISLTNFLLDELPEKVNSLCHLASTGVDELAVYQFSYPSGCMASIGTSFNLSMRSEMVIYGVNGYIEFPNFKQGHIFTIHTHKGTNKIQFSEVVNRKNDDNGFVYEVEEVVHCIRDGKTESDIMTVDETIQTMKLLDSMRNEWGLRYPFE